MPLNIIHLCKKNYYSITLYVYGTLNKGLTSDCLTVVSCSLSQCEIWKRYSDFQHLSKQLELIHSHSRLVTTFPSIVKAKYFGKQLLNIILHM